MAAASPLLMDITSDRRSAQSGRKSLVDISVWRPSVHRNVAFLFFDVGSSYPIFTKEKEGKIVHLLTAVLIGPNSA